MAENSASDPVIDFIKTARGVIYIGHTEDVTGRRDLRALMVSLEGRGDYIRVNKRHWHASVDIEDPNSSIKVAPSLFSALHRQMEDELGVNDVFAFSTMPSETTLLSIANSSGTTVIDAIRKAPSGLVRVLNEDFTRGIE
jgi:hypothetical protein